MPAGRNITNIVQPLTYTCNKSFEYRIFPDEMKIAKFYLYLRMVNVRKFTKYKPVSILIQIKKYKKLLYNKCKYVKKNNIMYKSQY